MAIVPYFSGDDEHARLDEARKKTMKIDDVTGEVYVQTRVTTVTGQDYFPYGPDNDLREALKDACLLDNVTDEVYFNIK